MDKREAKESLGWMLGGSLVDAFWRSFEGKEFLVALEVILVSALEVAPKGGDCHQGERIG
jgi:hypothetical protein